MQPIGIEVVTAGGHRVAYSDPLSAVRALLPALTAEQLQHLKTHDIPRARLAVPTADVVLTDGTPARPRVLYTPPARREG